MAKNLTAESYSLLLGAFSSDEKKAAEAYTKLRDSLTRFFQIKGDFAPEEAADETLDLVAAKISENVLIDDLTKYSFGVARLIFYEHLRKTKKEKKTLEGYRAEIETQKNDDETDYFAPFRECFESLANKDKNLLRKYFIDLPYDELNESRRELTDELGVSLSYLRLKIFRLRRRLEDCVRGKRKII